MNTEEAIEILEEIDGVGWMIDQQTFEALTHAIEHMKRGAPEGWQLVPKKPTVEMKIVGRKTHWKAVEIYKEMLSTAPEPPQEGKD